MAKKGIAFLASMLLLALPLAAQSPEGAASQKPEAASNAQKAEADTKKPEPPKDKPFAELVKDAQVIKGLFTL